MQVLTEGIRIAKGEALIVHLLRALQALATVAGVLDLHDVMLATLKATCSFATMEFPPTLIATVKAAVPPQPPAVLQEVSGDLSPRDSGGLVAGASALALVASKVRPTSCVFSDWRYLGCTVIFPDKICRAGLEVT
jgi:hypothetical protein